MVKDEPKTPWTDYREKAGTLQYAIKELQRMSPEGKQLWKLRPDAPDGVKMAFERRFTNEIRAQRKYFVPELKDPYYTWEGNVVERSSLKGRELPLVE